MSGVSRVVIQETVEDLKTLMHQQAQTGDKERIQLLYLLKSGQAQTITQAAQMLGRGRATLQRWLAKYQQDGISGLLERDLPLRDRLPILTLALLSVESLKDFGLASEL